MAKAPEAAQDLSLYGLAAWAILCASVIVHELGHCLAAWRLRWQHRFNCAGPIGWLALTTCATRATSGSGRRDGGASGQFHRNDDTWSAVAFKRSEFGLDFTGTAASDQILIDPIPAVTVLKLAFWLNWLLVLANLFTGRAIGRRPSAAQHIVAGDGLSRCATHFEPEWNAGVTGALLGGFTRA